MSGYPIQRIREDYAALGKVTYLNTGTVGVMSESVLKRHLERIADYERFGHYRQANAQTGYEEARAAFAQLINASSSEIALTRNASDGINYVLSGLSHPAGASMITTSEEHPAVLLPISRATQAVNGSFRFLRLDVDDGALLENLAEMARNEGVTLAIISHVSCETGRRLPIAEICEICRENGVLTLVDGAQSVGQVDVDVAEIGCDFMTGNGHKWLCGPKGAGFLYVKQDRVEDLIPPYAGDGSVEPRFDRSDFEEIGDALPWGFRRDAQRFEFGTRNWHLYGAVVDSINELETLGWGNIRTHVETLTSRLKSELKARSGVTVATPMDSDKSCGIVTFTDDSWEGVELSNRLWSEHLIIQRRVQIPSGVRISCAHYTSHDDIDAFLKALDTVVSR